MHMAHLSENMSGVLKSSSEWLDYTGFPGDMCVAFFNVLPGNKDAMCLQLKTSAYQGQRNAVFFKFAAFNR